MDVPRSQQIRGLVDCDSFYASCEVFLNPQLRGRPVCIGGDIIIARSYEAKPYGIKVGTPVREAKKLLPKHAVFLPPRMRLYGRISSSLMSYLQEKCLQVEVFSIDEAFFEITGYAERYNLSYTEIARMLKEDIKKKIGIPVSIGIGPTRLLAKMFADVHKPFGECIGLDEPTIHGLLQSLALAEIPFIGPQTQSKLSYCCTTAYDYSCLDYGFVKKMLGRNGLKVWFELQGINASSFQANAKPKGISRTRSFNPHFTKDKERVRSFLLDNIDKAVEHLLDVRMRTHYIKLIFRSRAFQRFGDLESIKFFSSLTIECRGV